MFIRISFRALDFGFEILQVSLDLLIHGFKLFIECDGVFFLHSGRNFSFELEFLKILLNGRKLSSEIGHILFLLGKRFLMFINLACKLTIVLVQFLACIFDFRVDGGPNLLGNC